MKTLTNLVIVMCRDNQIFNKIDADYLVYLKDGKFRTCKTP